MRNLILAITMAALPSAPILAQSLQPGGQYSNDDRRVSVGLTIPFGNGGSRAEREPRLELVFDHRQRDANGLELRNSFNRPVSRNVRLGLALVEKPKVMINGREVRETGIRNNISSGALIGIGVLAAAGIGVLVVTGYNEDRCSPGGCDD